MGAKIGKIFFNGSVITERLYIDVKQNFKKKKKLFFELFFFFCLFLAFGAFGIKVYN